MVAVPSTTERTLSRRKPETARLCAVHRVERPLAELIRFVAGPTGQIVADLKKNLPGRGVWVTADRASITRAVAEKSFDRSLKRATVAGPDLATEVEELLSQRVCNALSIANKAGAVIAGFTKIDIALQKQALFVLIHAADAAADGRDKLTRKFLASCPKPAPEQRIVTILTTLQLSLAIGRSNVVHAGLTEMGVAKNFLFEARRLQQFGHGLGTDAAGTEHLIGNE